MSKLAQSVDVKKVILQARRIPCICRHQFSKHDVPGYCESKGISESRGVLVEKIECRECFKTWTRITA